MIGCRAMAAAVTCFSLGEADTVSVNYGTESGAAGAPGAPLGFKLALHR